MSIVSDVVREGLARKKRADKAEKRRADALRTADGREHSKHAIQNADWARRSHARSEGYEVGFDHFLIHAEPRWRARLNRIRERPWRGRTRVGSWAWRCEIRRRCPPESYQPPWWAW